MKVLWSKHARERFLERLTKHDMTVDEVEVNVKEQKVRIDEGIDEEYQTHKYKTIFPVRDNMVTVEKAEDAHIYILTLWESSEEEKILWKKR